MLLKPPTQCAKPRTARQPRQATPQTAQPLHSHCTPSHVIATQEQHSTPWNGIARHDKPSHKTAKPSHGTAQHAIEQQMLLKPPTQCAKPQTSRHANQARRRHRKLHNHCTPSHSISALSSIVNHRIASHATTSQATERPSQARAWHSTQTQATAYHAKQ
jgi:hypothetical protein